jgi:CelD/BcsL family acetyltransferase involved in cellulose biosynthesis
VHFSFKIFLFESELDYVVVIEGEQGAAAKLLSCDHEVIGLSPGNILFTLRKRELHAQVLTIFILGIC